MKGITIGVLILVSALLILFMIGRKSVSATVQIEANIDQVWMVLSDAETVKAWNTVLIPIQGDLAVGNTIKYEFYQEEGGKAAVMDAKVKEVLPKELINQAGGIPGVMTFDHKYMLSQNGGVTTVKIHEEYRGIMVPFWNPAPVELAYERLLIQLKQRVENE